MLLTTEEIKIEGISIYSSLRLLPMLASDKVKLNLERSEERRVGKECRP